MPFKSEKQRRFLWAQEPEVARRWARKGKRKKQVPVKNEALSRMAG